MIATAKRQHIRYDNAQDGVVFASLAILERKKARCWSFVRLLTCRKTVISTEPVSSAEPGILKSGTEVFFFSLGIFKI